MSISENVGGMSDYLGKLRTNDAYQELKQGVSDTFKKNPGLRRPRGPQDQKDKKRDQTAVYSGDVV